MGCEPLCGGLQPRSVCCLHDLHLKQPEGQFINYYMRVIMVLTLSLVGLHMLWLSVLHHLGNLCNRATHSDPAHLPTILQMASICSVHWFCLPGCCYAGTGWCRVGVVL